MADVQGKMGTEKFEERVAHRSRGRGLWGGRSDFSWRHKLDQGLHGGNGYARARRSRFRLTCAVRLRGASARGEIPSFSDPSFLTIQGRSGGRGVSEECDRKYGWKNVQARQRGVGGGRWVRSEDFRSEPLTPGIGFAPRIFRRVILQPLVLSFERYRKASVVAMKRRGKMSCARTRGAVDRWGGCGCGWRESIRGCSCRLYRGKWVRKSPGFCPG